MLNNENIVQHVQFSSEALFIFWDKFKKKFKKTIYIGLHRGFC